MSTPFPETIENKILFHTLTEQKRSGIFDKSNLESHHAPEILHLLLSQKTAGYTSARPQSGVCHCACLLKPLDVSASRGFLYSTQKRENNPHQLSRLYYRKDM